MCFFSCWIGKITLQQSMLNSCVWKFDLIFWLSLAFLLTWMNWKFNNLTIYYSKWITSANSSRLLGLIWLGNWLPCVRIAFPVNTNKGVIKINSDVGLGWASTSHSIVISTENAVLLVGIWECVGMIGASPCHTGWALGQCQHPPLLMISDQQPHRHLLQLCLLCTGYSYAEKLDHECSVWARFLSGPRYRDQSVICEFSCFHLFYSTVTPLTFKCKKNLIPFCI